MKIDSVDYITIKQIREDCCNAETCDFFRGCQMGASRNDECLLGSYLWFISHDGDRDDWSKWYDDLINPSYDWADDEGEEIRMAEHGMKVR